MQVVQPATEISLFSCYLLSRYEMFQNIEYQMLGFVIKTIDSCSLDFVFSPWIDALDI